MEAGKGLWYDGELKNRAGGVKLPSAKEGKKEKGLTSKRRRRRRKVQIKDKKDKRSSSKLWKHTWAEYTRETRRNI